MSRNSDRTGQTPDTSPDPASGAPRVVHPWFVSQFALGLCLLAGGFFLLPAYVNERGGSSGDIGLLIALIGVGALVSPLVGRLADRTDGHRYVQSAGVASASLASLGFATAEGLPLFAVSALLMGVAQAAIMSMNQALVLGTDAPESVKARSITALAAILIVGQAAGLAGVTVGLAAGMSYSALFVVAALVAAGALVMTAVTNRHVRVAPPQVEATEPTKQAPPPAGQKSQDADVRSADRRTLTALAGPLGAFLLAVLLSQTGQLALETQLPVYYEGVFGIDPGVTSGFLLVGVVLSLAMFLFIGRWTAASGPLPAWLTAQGLRVVGPIGLLIVGASTTAAGTGGAGAIALGLYIVMYLAYPLFNAAAPVLVSRVTTLGAGEAQGLLVGTLAVCGIVGPLLGGLLAGQAGLAALPWAPLVGGAAAIVITLVAVRPALNAVRKDA